MQDDTGFVPAVAATVPDRTADDALRAFEALSLQAQEDGGQGSKETNEHNTSNAPLHDSNTVNDQDARRNAEQPPTNLHALDTSGRDASQAPGPKTPATVGADFFTKELQRHPLAEHTTQTMVIIHEACYGHRFSRPRTSKSALSTIVERPERITAALLGLSAAYVRLGSRHAGGRHPPGHKASEGAEAPFIIRSSTRSIGLLSSPVVAVHGLDWMSELQAMCRAAGSRLALDGKELLRPVRHDPFGRPVQTQKFHEGDLYLCEESLEALQGAVGGVCDAVDAVFRESAVRRAFVAIRPPGHHCSADFPSGFCWLNNVHVGIQHAAQQHGLTHAVIFDFDLHHGDGSQEIAWSINEKSAAAPKNLQHSKKVSIGYYSLHDINSYPCEMGDREKVQNASLCIDNAHGQSIWNVHLDSWSTDAQFSSLYESKYAVLFTKARSFLQAQTERICATPKGGQPKAAIFISAGFDASQWEGAGMQRHAVNVPTSFYRRFTQDAVKLAEEAGTAAEGRVISVLEGGYSNRALTSGVLSHVAGLCSPDSTDPVPSEIKQAVNAAAGPGHTQPIDARWWNSEALTALESYEEIEVAAPKRSRNSGLATTFASPTASFNHKVIDPEKFQRSMAGTMRPIAPEILEAKVPDVDWIAATHALAKVLLPKTRTTTSCRPEELAAVKNKKSTQALGSVPQPLDPSVEGRQLRERRTKLGDGAGDSSENTPVSKPARGGRRRTLDVGSVHLNGGTPVKAKPASRRSSNALNIDLKPATPNAVPAVPAIPLKFVPEGGTAATPRKAPAARKQRSPTKPKAAPTKAPVVPAQNARSPSGLGAQSKPTPGTSGMNTSPSSRAGDVDSLTSAVKRITLKLGTREESEKKVNEQQAAVRKSGNIIPGPGVMRTGDSGRARKSPPALASQPPPQLPPADDPLSARTSRPGSSGQRSDTSTPRRSPIRRPEPVHADTSGSATGTAVSSQPPPAPPASFSWRPLAPNSTAGPYASEPLGTTQQAPVRSGHGFTSTSPIPFQQQAGPSVREVRNEQSAPGGTNVPPWGSSMDVDRPADLARG